MSFRPCSRVVLRSHWSRSTTSAWLHPPSAGSAEHGRLTERRIYDGSTDSLTPELDSLPPAMRAALVAHQLVEISYFEPIAAAAFTSARR